MSKYVKSVFLSQLVVLSFTVGYISYCQSIGPQAQTIQSTGPRQYINIKAPQTKYRSM